jgi:hypothetical protein
VVISRAPLAKLEAYKAEKGWSIAWFSSFGSDFNYDFHVTLDEKVLPPEANFRNKAETEAKKGHAVKMEGEQHGLSVFFQLDDDIFQPTRSTRAGANHCRTPIASSTRHPMGGSRTLRTRPQAGLRSRPMDKAHLLIVRHCSEVVSSVLPTAILVLLPKLHRNGQWHWAFVTCHGSLADTAGHSVRHLTDLFRRATNSPAPRPESVVVIATQPPEPREKSS